MRAIGTFRYIVIFLLVELITIMAGKTASAQNTTTLTLTTDTTSNNNLVEASKALPDTLTLKLNSQADSLVQGIARKIRKQMVPEPKRALWMALVVPGGGQIYNRKYWKLPIIYGGFLGCTYALLWNQQMYKDYSQAYIDIMDDDPHTASYEKMLPMGYSIAGKEEQFKNIFKHKKDFYRRNRDLSIFAFIGVYLISVIDAYVDAQLSTFDISHDLSMRLEPAVIKQSQMIGTPHSKTFGLQCSFSKK